MKLDEIDKRILKALQEQGRISNADLADSINLSQSACYRRVQRLEDDGIVKEYVALLDAKKMGVPTTVFVEITLSAQADEVLDAFEKEVARIPNVLECHLTAGTADYVLKVLQKVLKTLHEFIGNIWQDYRAWRRCSRLLH